MTRLFFHLHECGTIIEDEEGLIVEDLNVAHKKAVAAARDVMCGELARGHLCLSCRVDVVSEDGGTVLSVPFRDAVRITGI